MCALLDNSRKHSAPCAGYRGTFVCSTRFVKTHYAHRRLRDDALQVWLLLRCEMLEIAEHSMLRLSSIGSRCCRRGCRLCGRQRDCARCGGCRRTKKQIDVDARAVDDGARKRRLRAALRRRADRHINRFGCIDGLCCEKFVEKRFVRLL